MAQVGIVRRNNQYFREYAIEPNDNLSTICLRYGHRDWRPVYNHPENAAFRARFPDPNQIDFVNPVNLFIPLPGAATTGRGVRGKPIEDYYIVHIQDINGAAQPNISLKLSDPNNPSGRSVQTDANGDIIIANPPSGDHKIFSSNYMLFSVANAAQVEVPVEWSTLPTVDVNGQQLTEATPPITLTLNSINVNVIRPFALFTCPLCNQTFRVVENPPPVLNSCPNDGFDFGAILSLMTPTPDLSFTTSRIPPQNPKLTPTSLTCRGSSQRATAHGTMSVYWEESRFANPDGGDYLLWAQPATGSAITVNITGRSTWGATAPNTAPDRNYEFHEVAFQATQHYPYSTMGIPSNETTPLYDTLLWITVHHTTDPAQSSFQTARDLQIKHRDTDGIPDQGLAADIGYHFIIDANGATYEGRPLGIKGSHVGGFNGGNVGIVMAGDFESRLSNGFDPDVPTIAALDSLTRLCDVLALRFNIGSVWAHDERKRQAARGDTECPGDNMIVPVAALHSTYQYSNEP